MQSSPNSCPLFQTYDPYSVCPCRCVLQARGALQGPGWQPLLCCPRGVCWAWGLSRTRAWDIAAPTPCPLQRLPAPCMELRRLAALHAVYNSSGLGAADASVRTVLVLVDLSTAAGMGRFAVCGGCTCCVVRYLCGVSQVLRKNYSHEADMWSLGVILYILLSGLPPFWGDTEDQIFRMVRASATA